MIYREYGPFSNKGIERRSLLSGVLLGHCDGKEASLIDRFTFSGVGFPSQYIGGETIVGRINQREGVLFETTKFLTDYLGLLIGKAGFLIDYVLSDGSSIQQDPAVIFTYRLQGALQEIIRLPVLRSAIARFGDLAKIEQDRGLDVWLEFEKGPYKKIWQERRLPPNCNLRLPQDIILNLNMFRLGQNGDVIVNRKRI